MDFNLSREQEIQLSIQMNLDKLSKDDLVILSAVMNILIYPELNVKEIMNRSLKGIIKLALELEKENEDD